MRPLEALHAVFDAWEAGTPDALRPLFTADGAYLDPLKPGPLEGVDAIVEGNRDAMSAIEDCRITVRMEMEDEDRGIAEGVFSSRLANGGAPFDFPFAAVVDMRDGRIERLAEYFDTRPLV